MSVKLYVILCFLCFANMPLFASENLPPGAVNLRKQHTDAPDKYAGRDSMNGYKLKDFENFEKNWKLVTVRHREDTKEMRFTYANDLAWETLNSGKTDYPKGAVFAKIGFSTTTDPIFESSVVPSGAKRYQFMIRDVEKFKETDGWGYALFNSNGKTFNGEPHGNSLACAACHKVAQGRGFVFSQVAVFSPFIETRDKTIFKSNEKISAKNLLKFQTIDATQLPSAVVRHLLNRSGKVDELIGNLKENMFEGTLNEIIPTLMQNTLKENRPSVLANKTGDLFSLVYIDEATASDCAKNQKKLVTMRTIQRDSTSATLDGKILKINEICK